MYPFDFMHHSEEERTPDIVQSVLDTAQSGTDLHLLSGSQGELIPGFSPFYSSQVMPCLDADFQFSGYTTSSPECFPNVCPHAYSADSFLAAPVDSYAPPMDQILPAMGVHPVISGCGSCAPSPTLDILPLASSVGTHAYIPAGEVHTPFQSFIQPPTDEAFDGFTPKEEEYDRSSYQSEKDSSEFSSPDCDKRRYSTRKCSPKFDKLSSEDEESIYEDSGRESRKVPASCDVVLPWKAKYLALKTSNGEKKPKKGKKNRRTVRDSAPCHCEHPLETRDHPLLFLILNFHKYIPWSRDSTTKALLFKRGCCEACLQSAVKFWGNTNRGVPYFALSGKFKRIWDCILNGWTFTEIFMKEFVETASCQSERDMLLHALLEMSEARGVDPVSGTRSETFILRTPIHDRFDGLYARYMFLLATCDGSKGKELASLSILPKEKKVAKGIKKELYLLFMNAKSDEERRSYYEAVRDVSKFKDSTF
ncbi:hypothetical protein ADUPG1_007721 [Aduncisulcus paluster]|uniref:Uncharacterized protein n=1 Tax=Aduncisulcus paluster TaxID=2918883 RepID=A0ABQ5KPB4_9EUKA|nr:hypothetical protein ADUPG1_007721 [Aduncisulcus paluster]